jgi:hypothetical protein
MSMGDAVRAIREKLPDWMGGAPGVDIEPPVIKTPMEDMAEIVRASSYQGMMDKQSSTWLAVSAWAATDLLETLAKLETARDHDVIVLQARARALRDIMDMDQAIQKPVLMKSSAPYIP